MNFFKNLGSTVKSYIFGETKEDDEAAGPSTTTTSGTQRPTRRTASKPTSDLVAQPVLVEAGYAPGGVQGLKWYAASQKRDEHGDVANEFFEEGNGAGLEVSGTHRSAKRLEVQRVHEGSVILTGS